MAEASEEFPAKLLQQLQNVNCELLGSRELTWLRELVFSSSEHHNTFLKWLLHSFDSNLDATMTETQFSKLSVTEQQKYLHKLCTAVGLCKESDIAVIQGTAKREVTLAFWDLLLTLHLTHASKGQESDENHMKLTHNLSGISVLEKSNSSDVSSPFTDSTFTSTWRFLTPDIEHEINKFAKTNSIELPAMEEIMAETSTLKEKCRPEVQKEDLVEEELKDVHGQIMSSLQSLHEMMPSFRNCHRRLQPFIKKNVNKPGTNNLGDLVKKASDKMDLLQQMLNDLKFETKNEEAATGELKPVDSLVVDDNSDTLKTLQDALK